MKPNERLRIPRQGMPEQEADCRKTAFTEVNLGFPEQAAMLEAQRCLQCNGNPSCVTDCPVGVDVPRFLAAICNGDLKQAAEILYATNALPAVTGRVCPQEVQCEARCVRGKKGKSVAIGHLERFVADWARTNRPQPSLTPTGLKVAIVGSGPAGLTCAAELAKRGYGVTVFEALHEAGGVLIYGIPEFRLPKVIVAEEVSRLMTLGVRFELNVIVGKTVTIPELLGSEGYRAVFIANGAGLPVFLGLPGENLKGVYSANEYLTRINLMGAFRENGVDTPVLRGQRVVVVGGGNTAMDAVRSAKRIGASSATLAYRRSRAEMPARAEEVKHAEEEGVVFEFLVNPVEITGDQDRWVNGIKCQRMTLGEPDSSGRSRPIPIRGSEFVIPCEVVVQAIGTKANPLLTQSTPGLELNQWGYIKTDSQGMTSLPGVFAGGDIVRGSATVILAMGDGKCAAQSIDQYLNPTRSS